MNRIYIIDIILCMFHYDYKIVLCSAKILGLCQNFYLVFHSMYMVSMFDMWYWVQNTILNQLNLIGLNFLQYVTSVSNAYL